MADILHQFIVKSDHKKVYDAFCTSEGLESWWPKTSKGVPRLGEVYTFYFGPEYDWRGEVIHCRPGEEITWMMTQASETWMGTTVGIRLTPHVEGTNVFFFHRGWKEPGEHYSISNFCWAILLWGLKSYVEKGEIVPFENRQ